MLSLCLATSSSSVHQEALSAQGQDNLPSTPYVIGLGHQEQGFQGCSSLMHSALWAEESMLCFAELKHV